MTKEQIQKLAEKNNKEAQAKLSLAYFNGDGVTQSNKDGLKWLQLAAESQTVVSEIFRLSALKITLKQSILIAVS